MAVRVRQDLSLAVLGAFGVLCIWGLRPVIVAGQGPAEAALSKWQSNDYPGVRYVGSAQCGQCHSSHFSTQPSTPMARALQTAQACQILTGHPRMQFHEGPYTYEIARAGNASTYSVSDGVKTLSEPILYGFGDGLAGQTYVFRHNGVFYESRLSYYQATGNLDITTGHPRVAPSNLEEALGRPMNIEETRNCFSCHATFTSSGSTPDFDHVVPGVTCERCHGPGEKHIAAVKAGRVKDPQIFNPGSLTADELSQEFCGTCHRSFDQVMLMPGQAGPVNVRFQPYRIFNSKGHNTNDPRMSCIACHDPHDGLKHDEAFYDSKCLACHLSSRADAKTTARSEAPCPVSTRQCVTCHMPKIDLPQMHFKFTDHWVRVVKPGDPVPR
jgi:hypothetical protein